MTNLCRRAVLAIPLLAAGVSAALAQAPTEAQREAIKSACRSDYMAHCSSIPPGGAASLECLQKNMSSLSSGCAGAVRAVEAPAATETKSEAKPEAKPEATPAAKETAKETTKETKPAAEPAATPKAASAAGKKPSSAQIAAIRSACRSDYPKVCAGVPTGGAAALECLEKNKAKVSPACEKAVAAAGGGAATAAGSAPAATAAAAPAAAAAAAPTVLVLRPMRPREVLFVMRSACGADVRALCSGIPVGGGRIIECLRTQAASLSPDCKGVLGQFAAQ
ncbi:hypothetical protein [Bradyrhizobium sp. NP1]|uniref:cysteine rich repeat-containing protein n=1 Tax=Bradyrhizobium sp. NP1 TaxID=3049772 RepID=UPI0025A5A1A2|nr:hypothetical protein [Bradyrhizobium sp. NP1]WJR78025.1 hypothetical protein QOU61_35900 [Bradyrhizobium sp. NP1]